MCQPMPGLKKQFNRTSQYLSEKVGGVKDDTELEEKYFELVRKVDVMDENVSKIKRRLKEYMQPNSSARAALAVQTCLYNVKGQTGTVETKFLEPESKLANVLLKAGNGLLNSDLSTLNNNTSNGQSKYAPSLLQMGEAFTKLSEVKENMVEDVRVALLSPLYEMQNKHLKNISFEKKKLESRRLDYKYKKGQGDKIPVEEFEKAKEKFEVSKEACFNSMTQFIEIDEEDHIKMLQNFADVIKSYHRECAEVMGAVKSSLQSDMNQQPDPDQQKKTIGEEEAEDLTRKLSESSVTKLSTKADDKPEKIIKDRAESINTKQSTKSERRSSQISNRSQNIERSSSLISKRSEFKKRFSQQSFNNTTIKYTNDGYASDASDLNTSLPSMVV